MGIVPYVGLQINPLSQSQISMIHQAPLHWVVKCASEMLLVSVEKAPSLGHVTAPCI
jgi:hypothetical protein